MFYVAGFALSLISALIFTPIFIRKLRDAKITGIDVHKENKPEIPEMGGLSILFAFSIGLLFSIPFFIEELLFIFAATLTILIAGIIGICDDIMGIRQRTKALLPLFASIPLVVTQAGVHTMFIPFFGNVNFGLFFPLILIPLAVTVVSNSFNMMAGYNGLEAGLGFITSFFIGIASIIVNRPEAAIITFSIAGACLGFLKYNKHPARIFPGDVGTFVIGAAIASTVIIGNMETIGIIVILPLLINGVITIIDALRKPKRMKFSSVKNGILVPPPRHEYGYTLYYFLENRFTLTEKKLVALFWLISIAFGILGIGLLLIV